jgi:hypothetical protein
VIGPADRATGTREKNRAASKALAIGLDAGGDRTPGLRAFDHDDTHVNLPWIWFLNLVFVAFLTKTGRLDRASCLGGIVHLHFVGSSMWGARSFGLVPTGRISLLNELWT